VIGYPVTATLDFETLEDFTTSFGAWTAIDVKGGNTYGINQPNGVPYYFPNVNDPMAFICFNPSKTIPAITEMLPHGGQKLGCCFASVQPMNPNNKWLISPRVSLGKNPKIEFWMQTFSDLYDREKFNVAVSKTDLDPASFVLVNSAPEIAPLNWTQCSFDLSQYTDQDVYVGIQCVSDDTFIFMVDDISITSSLGVADGDMPDRLVFFPNPAATAVTIDVGSFTGSNFAIDLAGMAGGRVKSCRETRSEDRIMIDVSGIPDGLYILKVSDGRVSCTGKISIIH
jgi:hypothetical protein